MSIVSYSALVRNDLIKQHPSKAWERVRAALSRRRSRQTPKDKEGPLITITAGETPILARKTCLSGTTVELRLSSWAHGTYYDRPAVRMIFELSSSKRGASISSMELELRCDSLVQGSPSPTIVQYAPKQIKTAGEFSRTFINACVDSPERLTGCCGSRFHSLPTARSGYSDLSVFRLYGCRVREARDRPLTGYRVVVTVLLEEGPIAITTRLKVETGGPLHIPRAIPGDLSTTYRLDGLSAREKLRPGRQRFEDTTKAQLDDMVGYPGGVGRV